MMSIERPEQKQARIHNELRAFACRWYAGFDRGVPMDSLLPYLPEDEVEFVYPGQPAITRVQDLTAYGDKVAQTMDRTAHFLGDIHVRELQDGRYELLCVHTYEAIPRGGAAPMAMSLTGRMLVQLGLKTARDPEGAHPKIVGYKVTPTEMPVAGILPSRKELAPGAQILFSENDAKAFVYEWFSLIDAGNSETLGTLLVEKDLDVDILGNRVDGARGFCEFLLAQKNQQRWSAHVPLDVRVDMTNPAEPTVHFLLRYDGELVNGARLQLSNLTTWRLRFERDHLRLQRYRLVIL